ncbi:hypothetical protein IC582_021218 [Cucumis melo]
MASNYAFMTFFRSSNWNAHGRRWVHGVFMYWWKIFLLVAWLDQFRGLYGYWKQSLFEQLGKLHHY